MATQQVNVSTVVGSITLGGNAIFTVTGARVKNSPKAITVAVTLGMANTDVALAAATALAFDVDVSLNYLVAPSGATVVLTERVANANDSTLNVASANGTCTGLTPQPTSTTTVQGDGLSNAYITLAQAKDTHELAYLDSTYDVDLSNCINAVSREIDNTCNQRFYVDAADVTKYFSPSMNDQCIIDPMVSITSLATDSSLDRTYATVWATTDYDLYPYNSPANGEPYWRIDITPNGKNTFNAQPYATPYAYPYPKANAKYVKIVGKFGWPAVPEPIKRACILWTLRTWARSSTPLGVSAMSALGQMKIEVPPLDPDIDQLLSNYRLTVTGII